MIRSLLALPLAVAVLTAPLAAQAQDVDLLHAVPTRVTVSSAYRATPQQAARLVDGDLETAWNSASGDLIGAWIEVELPANVRVTAIRMTVGFTHRQGERDLFMGNHRITDVAVSHDGDVTLAQLDSDERGLQTIQLAGGGGTFRIVVTGQEPGDHRNWTETCVSELQVMGQAPGARAGTATPTTHVVPASSTRARSGVEGVYFAVNNTGVGVVRAGGRAREVFRDSYVWDGLVATRTGVYGLDEQGLFELSRGQRRPVPRLPGGDGARAIARDAEGRLLALARGGVFRLERRRWHTLTDLTSLDYGHRFTRLAVDGDGIVWLLHSSRGPHRIRDGALQAMTIPNAQGPFGRLAVGPDGTAAVSDRMANVHRWDPREGSWRSVSRPVDGGRVTGLLVRPDGEVWAGGYSRVVRIRASGAPAPVRLPGALQLRSLGSSAYDAQGNQWVGSGIGIFVITPQTRVLRRYGSIPLLHGQVEHMAIVGDGPFY